MKMVTSHKYAKIIHAVVRWDCVLYDQGPMGLLLLQDLVIRKHQGADMWEIVAYMTDWLKRSHEAMGAMGDEAPKLRDAQKYMLHLAMQEMAEPLFEEYVREQIQNYNKQK